MDYQMDYRKLLNSGLKGAFAVAVTAGVGVALNASVPFALAAMGIGFVSGYGAGRFFSKYSQVGIEHSKLLHLFESTGPLDKQKFVSVVKAPKRVFGLAVAASVGLISSPFYGAYGITKDIAKSLSKTPTTTIRPFVIS